MADMFNRGPVGALGPLMGTPNSSDPYDGPSFHYQGEAIPDVRSYPANKDGQKAARIPAFMNAPFAVVTDQIPMAYNTAALAAAAGATSGTAMTLKTTCAGGAAVSTSQSTQCIAQVPLIPFVVGGGFPNQGALVSVPPTSFTPATVTGTGGLTNGNVLALDFGYMVGTTTAGSASVTAIPDVNQLSVGQWIVIGGAGNSTNTLPLVTQIITIGATTLGTGTMTISPVAAGSLTAAPIGSANFYGPFPAQGAANAVNPYLGTGVVACFNPTEALARGISVTASATAVPTSYITILGYDIYGMQMSERITPVQSSTVYGKKAFKYVIAAVPNFTDTTAGHTYSIGISDVFGMHLRSDRWEYLETLWNGAVNTSSTGWLAAVQTSPATQTTGDVRGTLQVSAIGGGSGYGATTSNGSIRFVAMINMPLFNLTAATPTNSVPLYGVPQV